MHICSIGEAAQQLGISADTLRYYEKINLIPRVARNVSGIRSYSAKDLSRLRFIKRAQAMNFSLKEIAELLKMREKPTSARQEVRELTYQKLEAVKERLNELQTLHNELQLLVNLCADGQGECPIIERLDSEDTLIRK
jgi:DNA-binding transcriptional MerR regulator